MEELTCIWTQATLWDNEEWITACGKAFVLNDGTPADNEMRYCCFCGKALRQRSMKNDAQEETLNE